MGSDTKIEWEWEYLKILSTELDKVLRGQRRTFQVGFEAPLADPPTAWTGEKLTHESADGTWRVAVGNG